MATAVNPVTQKTAWTYPFTTPAYITTTGSLSAPDAYAFGTGSAFQSNNDRMVFQPSVESNSLALKFIGDPDSPSTVSRGIGAIWGTSKLTESGQSDEVIGEYLGQFDLTVGTAEATSSSILPTSPQAYFCNRIDPRVDASLFPGMRVVGQQEDAGPVLLIDSMGYDQFIVELRCELPAGSSDVAADGLAFIYRVF